MSCLLLIVFLLFCAGPRTGPKYTILSLDGLESETRSLADSFPPISPSGI